MMINKMMMTMTMMTMTMMTMTMNMMTMNMMNMMMTVLIKVDLVPCTQYKFKVAAYEFFHGTGKIFPVWSKEVRIVLSSPSSFCLFCIFCLFCLFFPFFVYFMVFLYFYLSDLFFVSRYSRSGSTEVGKVGMIIFLDTILIIYSFDSFQVVFVLDYTPKFIVPPIVYEKVNLIQNLQMMQNKEKRHICCRWHPR